MALFFDAKTGEFSVNREDDLVAGTMVATGGEVVKRG
jgi:hypothetical protein